MPYLKKNEEDGQSYLALEPMEMIEYVRKIGNSILNREPISNIQDVIDTLKFYREQNAITRFKLPSDYVLLCKDDPYADEYLGIHLAAKVGYIEALDLLLQEGQDLYARTGGRGLTVLHVAAEYNQVDMINYLVKNKKMDVNILNLDQDEIPIYRSVDFLHVEATEVLLQLGAKLNLHRYKSVIERVRDHNYHVDAKDATEEKIFQMIGLLLKNGASFTKSKDIKSTDGYFESLMDGFWKNRSHEFIARLKVFLQKVEKEIENKKEKEKAKEDEKEKKSESSQEKKSSPSSTSGTNSPKPSTPLFFTDQGRQKKSSTSDTNNTKVDYQSLPAFIEAASQSQVEAIPHFIQAGTHKKDQKGTALYYSLANGHLEVSNLLMQHDYPVEQKHLYAAGLSARQSISTSDSLYTCALKYRAEKSAEARLSSEDTKKVSELKVRIEKNQEDLITESIRCNHHLLDKNGECLKLALTTGKIDIVKRLLGVKDVDTTHTGNMKSAYFFAAGQSIKAESEGVAKSLYNLLKYFDSDQKPDLGSTKAHEILGVWEGAPKEIVQMAYKMLMKKGYHPNQVGSLPNAEKHFVKIKTAYESMIPDEKKHFKPDTSYQKFSI